ncbi:MAG: Na+/H+ antiporter subunit E [Firmicutes bacterium]|jgi:multicomponent Na+:H+ antiporter subunit E|nr:Na+/H+ antiporter subunit E [Bacillota bacterium]
MRKRSVVLFTLLLAFWLVISAEADLQHIAMGAILALVAVWFWQDLGPRLPHVLSARELLLLGHCLVSLAWFVIQSNIAVAKSLLFSSPPVGPVFVVMRPPIESHWGRVLLATCITITPGTVTVDIDPETGQFIVHALTEETAAGLFDWQIIHEISNLESWRQRRAGHAVASSGSYGVDSLGTLAGDHRSDSY